MDYVGHVRQPTLILNGELDFFFPLETSQRPLFELLGTPAADKKRLIFPGGHSVPRPEQIKESLAWLDRYLGPVAPKPPSAACAPLELNGCARCAPSVAGWRRPACRRSRSRAGCARRGR